MRIQDLPRYLGQHSGGMVIYHVELNQIVPLERASMPGRTVVQWDKEDYADLGITGRCFQKILLRHAQKPTKLMDEQDHDRLCNQFHG
jgi:hypothetical protein